MWTRFVCVFVCLLFGSCSGAQYSNSWAVEITGGDAVADAIAKKHGVLNLGKVKICANNEFQSL